MSTPLRTLAVIAATLAATPVFAQTAVVPVEGTPTPAVIVTDWPSFKPDQMANNESIAQVLLAQGFSDVKILREGSLMTVTAQRDGQPIELVYSLIEGALISVNGETVRTESQKEAFGRETSGDKAASGMAGDDAAVAPEGTEEGTKDSATGTEGTDDSGTEGTGEGSESSGETEGGESETEGGTNG